MANVKQHISIRLASLLLAFVLVLPSVVKFSHALSSHEHEVCFIKNQTHFHNIDIDCEFYKFKLSNSLYIQLENYSLTANDKLYKPITTYHNFLKSHQHLPSYLRGPPSLM
ncbi:hypothetical protein [uncultured Psychroserpens sp.]|uniref:hypothetical protein n=1 Tax=uncultured Psychroserpens sp. TaxID=255436 RepID=UPI002638F2E1|nr:hypothetical protein [uncultured Psychroserpens sp.]